MSAVKHFKYEFSMPFVLQGPNRMPVIVGNRLTSQIQLPFYIRPVEGRLDVFNITHGEFDYESKSLFPYNYELYEGTNDLTSVRLINRETSTLSSLTTNFSDIVETIYNMAGHKCCAPYGAESERLNSTPINFGEGYKKYIIEYLNKKVTGDIILSRD